MAAQDKDTEYYVGLMSGTSIDGLDGVIIAITPADTAQGALCFKTIATGTLDWPVELKNTLHQLCQQGSETERVEPMYAAANGVATYEAQLVKQLLAKAQLQASEITAIGAHGQTIRHCPQQGFSVQIDNGPLLAHSTGIDAVVNFRAADLACGGQGAPLTQAFHQKIFARQGRSCFVLNLGGIANVTALGKDGELLTAFDTGPANTLLDYVCRTYLGTTYDKDGACARAGSVDQKSLQSLMEHPYLKKDFPKSTGREDFNADTIAFMLQGLQPVTALPDGTVRTVHTTHTDSTACPAPAPATPITPDQQRLNNVLATLTEYTALSVTNALEQIIARYPDAMSAERDLVLCGGGALNPFLRERLQALAAERQLHLHLKTCSEFGVDAKFLEAQAFAYFAYCTIHGQCLNLGKSTGAQSPALLGCICPAPHGHYARLANGLQLLTAPVLRMCPKDNVNKRLSDEKR